MAEYIEREKVLQVISEWNRDNINCNIVDYLAGWNEAIEQLECNIREDIPTADVAPVIHGHWIRPIIAQERSYKWQCSVCSQIACCVFNGGKRSKKAVCKFAYCPNCGAKMDGEETKQIAFECDRD